MQNITKRNGMVEEFNQDKIFNAIKKALKGTGEYQGNDKFIQEMTNTVVEKVKESHEEDVNVEYIQDLVEETLSEYGLFRTAKAYILYREKRKELREKGWEMTDLQRNIYESKYRYNNESFGEFLDRIAKDNQYIRKAILDKKFLPAGRILAGRGLDQEGKKICLSNCFVMPQPEDNIESIYDIAKYMARTYSYGGGCGVNVSKLRPRGAQVNNASNTTTGAVSFMELYNLTTGLIGMKGRRGALMINLDCSHPDLEEFIDVKTDLDKITKANISINITNEFMEAVKNDMTYLLRFYVEDTGEKIEKEVNAREVFHKLALNNWKMAEPGVLFKDRVDSYHLMSEDDTFSYAGVNPCAEEPLPAFGSCNLASINLSEFVENPFTANACFNFKEFERMVEEGVFYLNEILEENERLVPLEQQKEVLKELRQIGLGTMGAADAFIKMGIKYGSEESKECVRQIFKTMANSALQASAKLAEKEGPFPRYRADKVLETPFIQHVATEETLELIKKHGLRNSQILTLAPTGSISTMLGVSGGVEPIFQISYTRKTESLGSGDQYFKVYTPIVKEIMEFQNIPHEGQLPDFIVTSGELDYKDRIDIQSIIQEYTDASISSTVNLSNETTVETVEELYLYAWEKGLKGITIYRDGCERTGILTNTKTGREKIKDLQDMLNREIATQLTENPEECPMCGGKMNHTGGCSECEQCGYSPCAV